MIKYIEEASVCIDTADVLIPYITSQIPGVLLCANTIEGKLLLKSRAFIGRVIECRGISGAHIALIIIVPLDSILYGVAEFTSNSQ